MKIKYISINIIINILFYGFVTNIFESHIAYGRFDDFIEPVSATDMQLLQFRDSLLILFSVLTWTHTCYVCNLSKTINVLVSLVFVLCYLYSSAFLLGGNSCEGLYFVVRHIKQDVCMPIDNQPLLMPSGSSAN